MLQTQGVKVTAQVKHKRLLARSQLRYEIFLVLAYLALGVYLLAFKANATEAQKLYASIVLTAIASGSAGYAFGKKPDKE